MKRLYWTRPDLLEAEVEVTALGDRRVTTDPVIFHPDEGGQPADRGTIGGSAVRSVAVVEGAVVHTLDRPLNDGKHVARLDAEHRRYTASQHTAQHILSGIAQAQFGLATVGVHIGLEGCTVDFDRSVDWDVARDLECRATEVALLDLPVETVFGDEDVRGQGRFGPIESDVVRVVRIGDYDKSACCGAHVATTGQIGVVRIFELEKKKQGTRASFCAGLRALEQSQAETSVLAELRKTASCSTAELPSILQRALGRSKELAKEVRRVWSLRLSDLARSAEEVTIESSPVGIYVGELPRELVSTLAGAIAESVGAGVVVADTQIAVSSRTVDAGSLFRKVQQAVGGKGGGSAKAANGKLDRPVATDELKSILTGSV
jgi:alanyl-tRNA synthetase